MESTEYYISQARETAETHVGIMKRFLIYLTVRFLINLIFASYGYNSYSICNNKLSAVARDLARAFLKPRLIYFYFIFQKKCPMPYNMLYFILLKLCLLNFMMIR